jgi:putative oxidoreductase
MPLLAQFRDILSGYGIVAARLMLSAVFLYSGQDKLRHWRASVVEVAELGIPVPALFAAGAIATQIAGGLAVALGIGTAAGAALLAVFTTAATLLGHRFWLLHGTEAKRQLTTSLEHLAIVGGLILVGVGALPPG